MIRGREVHADIISSRPYGGGTAFSRLLHTYNFHDEKMFV